MTIRPAWYHTAFPRPSWQWLVALGWLVLIVSFLLISTISMISVMAPPSGNNLDKLLHLGAYGVLTFGMVFALPKRSLAVIFAVTFVYGVIIELMQGAFGEGRTASAADALANGLGALIIILFWIWLSPRLKHILA